MWTWRLIAGLAALAGCLWGAPLAHGACVNPSNTCGASTTTYLQMCRLPPGCKNPDYASNLENALITLDHKFAPTTALEGHGHRGTDGDGPKLDPSTAMSCTNAPASGQVLSWNMGSGQCEWINAGSAGPGTGDVTGPGASVNARITTWDGTGGDMIADNGYWTIDSGVMAASIAQTRLGVGDLTPDAKFESDATTAGLTAGLFTCATASPGSLTCTQIDNTATGGAGDLKVGLQVNSTGAYDSDVFGIKVAASGGTSTNTALEATLGNITLVSGRIGIADSTPDFLLDIEDSAGFVGGLGITSSGVRGAAWSSATIDNTLTGGSSGQFDIGQAITLSGAWSGRHAGLYLDVSGAAEQDDALYALNGNLVAVAGNIEATAGTITAGSTITAGGTLTTSGDLVISSAAPTVTLTDSNADDWKLLVNGNNFTVQNTTAASTGTFAVKNQADTTLFSVDSSGNAAAAAAFSAINDITAGDDLIATDDVASATLHVSGVSALGGTVTVFSGGQTLGAAANSAIQTVSGETQTMNQTVHSSAMLRNAATWNQSVNPVGSSVAIVYGMRAAPSITNAAAAVHVPSYRGWDDTPGYNYDATSAADLTEVTSFRSVPSFARATGGNGLAIAGLDGFFSGATIGGSTTVTLRRAVNIVDATGAGTVTTQVGVDVAALAKGTTNIGIRNASTTVNTPSTAQTLAAGTAILANASTVLINSSGAVTSTAAPTIADGQDGQVLLILNNDSADAITLSDQGTLASSNLRLSATTIVLGPRDSLRLMYSSSVGDWVQIGQTNVL